MFEKRFATYIMTNRPRGTLYTGVTSALIGRVREHREGRLEGFTKRYNLKRLVWYEFHPDAEAAIAREKRVKRWLREWKDALIEEQNPEWRDLWYDLAPTSDWD